MANTSGEKELKTSWDEQTALDSTKAIGHTINLIPEKSFIKSNDEIGIE
jgi:hypothetical protein